MTDLTFIPTQTLVDEIASRHDHMIVTGIQLIQGQGKMSEIYRYYKGSYLACIGLCEDVKQYVIMDSEPDEEDEDGEETPEGV